MSKRTLEGKVVSTKNIKTLVVNVERKFRHPVLSKVIKQSKKYHAHYEDGTYAIGDTVKIVESGPISKLKKWRVLGDKK